MINADEVYRHSYQTLGAAQQMLDLYQPNNDKESWAAALTILRAPLQNGAIVDGATYAYFCGTVAAASMTELASVRRAARKRVKKYTAAFYGLGLSCPVFFQFLPNSWKASPGIFMLAAGVYAIVNHFALARLTARAWRTFKPAPPPPAERDHG